MDKKAIMLKFLMTIILALIIFLPACYVSSKFFRLSDQAKDNYNDFVNQINKFIKKSNEGDRKSNILILDEGTAITYFEKGVSEIFIEVNTSSSSVKGYLSKDYLLNIKKPNKCKEEKNCLCLIRDINSKIINGESDIIPETFSSYLDVLIITPKIFICENIDSELKLNEGNCGFGESVNVLSYTCHNGFMIDRKMIEGSHNRISSYYELQRRTILTMENRGNFILLE